MNLESLVRLHKHYLEVPQSLPENIGDGFLCEHNLIYKNVRKYGLSCGTTFNSKRNTRWNDYMVFPLVNFDELLQKKEIPYVDNYNVLARLSSKYPTLGLPEKFIRDVLKRNYLLHETCHCIAQDYLTNTSLVKSFGIDSEKSIKLFDSLLGESLANSIEVAAIISVNNPTHIMLYVLNSYIPYSADYYKLVNNTVDQIGILNFLRVAFVSFFFNNLLGYEHSEENIELWFDIFKGLLDFEVNNKDRKILLEALYKCCRLNPRFRDETSVVYFSSLGSGDDYKKLSQAKVLSHENYVGVIAEAAKQFSSLILDEN